MELYVGYDHVNYQVIVPSDDILCAKAVSEPCETRDGSQTHYPTPCRGDSGSGLMATTKSLSSCSEQWFVFGVVSFSDKFCGHYQESSTAFISTLKHRKWILKVRI